MIYVVAFDPIKILTWWDLQNDRQNLSFVKDVNVVAKKIAKNGHKMVIYEFFSYKIENKKKLKNLWFML